MSLFQVAKSAKQMVDQAGAQSPSRGPVSARLNSSPCRTPASPIGCCALVSTRKTGVLLNSIITLCILTTSKCSDVPVYLSEGVVAVS